MNPKFGRSLFKMRRFKKITQQEVADRLNVSRQTYCCWENDYSEMPASKLFALEEIYGIELTLIIKMVRDDNN